MSMADPGVIEGFVAFAIIVLAPLVVYRVSESWRLVDLWTRSLLELGLRPTGPKTRQWSPRLDLYAGNLRVTLESTRHGGRRTTRIHVANELIPADLVLGAEGLATRVTKLVEGEDLLTGDQAFDAAVLVRGEPGTTLAVLDRNSRPAVLDAVRRGVRVAAGCVSQEVSGRLETSAEVIKAVQPQIELARKLSLPTNLVGRLSAQAHRDPVAGARSRCLGLLADRYPRNARSLDARHAALRDLTPEVRLAAARSLGQDGEATIVALGTTPGIPEHLAVEAIQTLASQCRRDGFGEILDAAVAANRTGVARALIEHLDAETAHRLTPRLTELLAGDDPELAINAAGALATAADIAGEGVLLAALARADASARLSIVAALGRIGSAAAVRRLHTVVEAHPLELALRRAATSAIAAIQQRLTGAEPGQVALTDGAAGDLSILDERGSGRLSTVEVVGTSQPKPPNRSGQEPQT
jgi:hypothetical protein